MNEPESGYVAATGMRFPSSPAGVKKAKEAKTPEALGEIEWTNAVIGDPVPDYIVKASPWLITDGHVAKVGGAL